MQEACFVVSNLEAVFNNKAEYADDMWLFSKSRYLRAQALASQPDVRVFVIAIVGHYVRGHQLHDWFQILTGEEKENQFGNFIEVFRCVLLGAKQLPHVFCCCLVAY